MDDKEYSNVYAIPANYTDSGKLMGGMLEIRNTIEAVFLVISLGYAEIKWIPVEATMKFVILVVTILPIGIVALMGIGGDSLGQFLFHMFKHWRRRRKLHMKRVGRTAPVPQGGD